MSCVVPKSCCRREGTVFTVRLFSLFTAGALLGALAATSVAQQMASAGQPSSLQAPVAPAARKMPVTPKAPPIPLVEKLSETWRWRTIEGPGGTARFSEVRPWKRGASSPWTTAGCSRTTDTPGSASPAGGDCRCQAMHDVVPQPDGLIAIFDSAILSISGAGTVTTLVEAENPYQITKPCHMPDGSLLVGIGDRIVRIDESGMHEAFPAPARPQHLGGVFLGPDGAPWAYTDRTLSRRAGDVWEQVAPAPELPRNLPRFKGAVTLDKQVCLLPLVLEASSGGYRWDGERMSLLKGIDPPGLVLAVTTTPDEQVIVAMRGPQLRVLDHGVWSEARLPDDHQGFVRSMCLTPDDRLAVVFASGDLAVCDLRSSCWEQHDPRDVGAGAFVNALHPASAGGVWAGTSVGVARWDGTRFADVHVELPALGMRLDHVTAVCEDSRRRLWVGSGAGFRGAACLDDGHWTLHAEEEGGVGNHFVHAIRLDGDDVWFLLLGDMSGDWMTGGMVRLRGDTFTQFMTDSKGQPMPRCYDLLRLSDGRLLAGTLGGLMQMDDDGWTRVKNGPPIAPERGVFALHETADGSLLVGLGLELPGAYRLHDGTWHPITSESGRIAPAASFCETEGGVVWFASALGLFQLDGDTCHDVSSLLPARTIWPLLPDGEHGLWLGMLGGGLARFCPEDTLPPRTLAPSLEFGDDGEVVASWYGVDAWDATPADQLRFSVEVDDKVIATSAPESWSTRNSRRVPLGKLSPGPHSLTITAMDSLGAIEPEPVRHRIPSVSERSPLLASAWAVFGAGLVLLLAIGWALMSWMKGRHERQLAQAEQAELNARLTALTRRLLSTQEDERQRLSRELHDNLGQICTALCIDIQRAARQPDAGRRGETLEHAHGVAREMLDRVRRMSSELRPLLLDDHGLQNAVSVALTEFTAVNGVDVQANLQFAGPEAPREVAGHIYRILQEALTNVAKHAEAQTVDVSLTTSEQEIALSVTDDGRGFVPEALALQSRCGLLSMRERAELAGGTFDLQSSPHGGTSIRVSIPLKRFGAEGRHAAQSGNDRHG